MNAAVLIPSLNPDEKLVNYVKALSESGFPLIIVVNDGSGSEYDSFFEQAAAVKNCVVLRHPVNRGKGCALKTGMKYYMENCTGYDGIVTGDADGQHTLDDTSNIARLMATMDDSLILGSRDFSGDDVPARSRFGNRTTSVVFKLAHGCMLGDTQTGLRGIPNKLIPRFSELKGDRYEYEMNMLIDCAQNNIKMVEEPIKTVYIDDNSSSHFHAVRDSFRIYSLILGSLIAYLISGLISYIVDQVAYFCIDRWLLPLFMLPFISDKNHWLWIAVAFILARIISSLVNFTLNKNMVFKKRSQTGRCLVRYAVLVVGVAVGGIALVWLFSNLLNISSVYVKPFVDIFMVLVSYTMQRIWVFRKDADEQ